jgi:hypothetical protein
MSFKDADLDMAPQPLSRVNPKALTTFGPECFNLYPELSKLVARFINTGSMIEARWSIILVNLMKADPHTGNAMYQALASSEARRAAIRAAAEVSLLANDFLLFQAVVKVTTPQRNTRNHFAHHIWGMSREVKGALLLADPEFFTDIVLGAKTKIEIEPSGIKFAPAFPKLDYSKIEVWTAKALQKENEDADETQKIIIDLTKVINRRDDEKEADQSRKSLLSRPLISQALQRLSRQSAQ